MGGQIETIDDILSFTKWFYRSLLIHVDPTYPYTSNHVRYNLKFKYKRLWRWWYTYLTRFRGFPWFSYPAKTIYTSTKTIPIPSSRAFQGLKWFPDYISKRSPNQTSNPSYVKSALRFARLWVATVARIFWFFRCAWNAKHRRKHTHTCVCASCVRLHSVNHASI